MLIKYHKVIQVKDKLLINMKHMPNVYEVDEEIMGKWHNEDNESYIKETRGLFTFSKA